MPVRSCSPPRAAAIRALPSVLNAPPAQHALHFHNLTHYAYYHSNSRECLESTWTKKAKGNLFKSRPLRHERLSAVYGFTGSLAAAVLLDILNEALDVERSDLYPVHVDISAVMEATAWTAEQNTLQHAALRHMVDDRYASRQWKLDIVKLEDLLNMTAADLRTLIESYKEDKTTQEDLLQYLVRSALIRYARLKGVHRILTSENASTLSIKAISSTAKGRGFQIAEECSIVQTMTDIDMMFAAPMHDALVDREIAHYFWTHKLECVEGPRLVPINVSQAKSINGLTSAFLMSLQRDFDHSMHTVMRSVEKLTSGSHSSRSDHVTTSLNASSSSIASSTADSTSSSFGHHRCTLCTRILSVDERLNPSSLCFSCDKMLFKAPELQTDAAKGDSPFLSRLLDFQRDVILSPATVRDASVRQHQVSKTSRKQMRQEIQEYLLDDAVQDLGAFGLGDDES